MRGQWRIVDHGLSVCHIRSPITNRALAGRHTDCVFTSMASAFRCVVVAAVAGLSLLSVQCASGGGGALADDGGTSDGSSAGCPKSEPSAGAACSLANGTVCRGYPYNAPGCMCCSGSPPSYVCTNGKWALQPGPLTPNAKPACPTLVPTEGAACDQCSALSCSYDCAHGNGYVSQAQCNGGAWHVSKSLIACEAPDASADVSVPDAPTDAPDAG
jgi:hypothetical protein